ncbi:hypothetical protein [Parachitinimonas caeni]|uniref:Uncharacterized protein n=1 Tax=Parachitinimonas caeni TaxID=3031301 RepID=A0ABT7DZC6_9NEIS|nr:hypothetical protein [Parachitinimonas caeni]MDK2125184.1 hypothetical protein [Parachitinimonas caeni]
MDIGGINSCRFVDADLPDQGCPQSAEDRSPFTSRHGMTNAKIHAAAKFLSQKKIAGQA